MIDPTFQNELMGALNTAVAAYNQDPNPNAAVVKAARAHDFNMEQTKRLVETFNTARTLYQYERGEKTAHFALADQSTVLVELFKPTEMATKAAEAPDYSEYDQPERMAKDGHVLAGTSQDIPVAAENPAEGLTLNSRAESAYKIIHSKRAAAEHAQDVSRQVSLAADQCFQKFADWFRHMPHEEAMDKYARCKAACQDDRVLGPIVKRAHEWMPNSLLETGEFAGQVVNDLDLQPALDILKEAQQLIEEACGLEAAGMQLQKEADAFEQEFVSLVTQDAPKPVEDPLASFFPKRASTSVATRIHGMPAAPQVMSPDALTEAYNKATKDITTTEEPDEKKPSITGKMVEKSLEGAAADVPRYVISEFMKTRRNPLVEENAKMTERLKNVQRQVILQDLMINDPMISEADRNTVQNAYLAVMQLAPEVTANKEVMRAILRHAIHSVAISPYDASSWVELERVLQDVRGTRKGMIQQGESSAKGKK